MSTPDFSNSPGSSGESAWEQLLRSVFGADADEAIQQMKDRGMDPDAMAAAAGLTDNPQMLDQILSQVRSLLSSSGDEPVNRDVAHDVARQTAAAGDPSLTAGETRAVVEALTVAELWLDSTTDFPPSGARPQAWNRAEWVENTLPAWNTLAEPIAINVVEALTGVLQSQLPDDLNELPGLGAIEGLGGPAALENLLGSGGGFDPKSMIRRLGSAVYGMQIGQAAGTLSREVFGVTDIGIPLLASPTTALVPTNISAFAEGLDTPPEEVRLYLALREAAYARIFTHVSWLRGHLLGLVDVYARGITIDTDALEDAVSQIDPTDPAAIQQALSGGVFGIATTEKQKATLDRLETTLALVEGWVDEVVTTAALPHLPHTIAMREMMRRRRAAGGPAEQTFASLVGLELRPRRSREAAALWALIAQNAGTSARDATWDHPDLLPEAVDLDDPSGYATRRAQVKEEQADVDRAIEELLSGTETSHGPAPEGTQDPRGPQNPQDPDGNGEDDEEDNE